MTTSDGHSRNSPSLARHKNLSLTDQWSTKQGWSAVVSGGIPPAPEPLTNGWTSFWPLVAVSPHQDHDHDHPPTLGVLLTLVRDLTTVKNIPQFVALRFLTHSNQECLPVFDVFLICTRIKNYVHNVFRCLGFLPSLNSLKSVVQSFQDMDLVRDLFGI